MAHILRTIKTLTESAVNRLIPAQSTVRRYFIEQKDHLFGRERIAVDRYGNRYYQYYSYHGLPTKRVVLYKFFDTNCFH